MYLRSVIVDLAALGNQNAYGCGSSDHNREWCEGCRLQSPIWLVVHLPVFPTVRDQPSELTETTFAKRKTVNINIDFEDVVLRGVTVVKEGSVTWPAPPIQVSAQPQQAFLKSNGNLSQS